jgi:hypothetical protein
MVLGAGAVVFRRRLAVAHPALTVAGACLAGWLVLASVV